MQQRYSVPFVAKTWFMTQLLSDDGSLTSAEWIELAEKELTDWFSQVNPLEFDHRIALL